MGTHRDEVKLGFNPKILRLAMRSTSKRILFRLGKDKNRFVRARVAGNAHINEQTHLLLLQDTERGVVLWALKNPITERRHVVSVIENTPLYCPVITPALAVHPLVTQEERKKFLLMIEEYKIKMGYK